MTVADDTSAAVAATCAACADGLLDGHGVSVGIGLAVGLIFKFAPAMWAATSERVLALLNRKGAK